MSGERAMVVAGENTSLDMVARARHSLDRMDARWIMQPVEDLRDSILWLLEPASFNLVMIDGWEEDQECRAVAALGLQVQHRGQFYRCTRAVNDIVHLAPSGVELMLVAGLGVRIVATEDDLLGGPCGSS